jgi:hypothetical protein
MPKLAQQRVNDTLNYLQNTQLVSASTRAIAHAIANTFVNVHYPQAQLSAGYQGFSDELSLGFHLGADPDERRRMTRALFLLWKGMRHLDPNFAPPLQAIGQIDRARVDRQLAAYMRKARCIQDRINNVRTGAKRVIRQLRNHTREFLEDNKLIVFGSGTLNGGAQNILPAQLLYEPARDRYEIVVNQQLRQGAAQLQVESVTAFHWTDPRYVAALPVQVPPLQHNINTAQFNAMTGIQLSRQHLMVTTQFTGCAFCHAVHAGSMYCAHVSPAGVPGMGPNTDGTTLAARVLASNGAFQNAGNTQVRVYGRGRGSAPHGNGYNLLGGGGGNADYMTIVGVPAAPYDLYSQTTLQDAIHAVTQVA